MTAGTEVNGYFGPSAFAIAAVAGAFWALIIMELPQILEVTESVKGGARL
jgi:hypothetical protein